MSAKEKRQEMSGAGLMVVATMCLSLVLVIVAACVMSYQEKDLPEVLDRVLGGLLIGVPALLAKTYRDLKDGEPEPVHVVNNASSPVPTLETETETDVLGAELDEGIASSRRRRREKLDLNPPST